MKIVIAPDSFKESLSAMEVATCIERGFSRVFPDCNYLKIPLADGGEGTVDVLVDMLHGEKQYSEVKGPIGGETRAKWAMLDDGKYKTALIEIAAASGLDLITTAVRNPLITTSYGTGQIIKQALDFGADKIILGLGGSATNDGGAGILQALGAKLLDAKGFELPVGGAALANLVSIDLEELDQRCANVEFIVACDVNNPLTGKHGASAVFGPQKGATPEMVEQLDLALAHFANIAEQTLGANHQKSVGFGAAGGAPLGLSLAFNLKIQAGIDMVMDILGVDKSLEGADLVITGEGQMDNQTINGKTPYGVAKRAKLKGIPVIGIAGSLGLDIEELHPTIDAAFDSVRAPLSLEQVLNEAEQNVTRAAKNIATVLLIGTKIQKC